APADGEQVAPPAGRRRGPRGERRCRRRSGERRHAARVVRDADRRARSRRAVRPGGVRPRRHRARDRGRRPAAGVRRDAADRLVDDVPREPAVTGTRTRPLLTPARLLTVATPARTVRDTFGSYEPRLIEGGPS